MPKVDLSSYRLTAVAKAYAARDLGELTEMSLLRGDLCSFGTWKIDCSWSNLSYLRGVEGERGGVNQAVHYYDTESWQRDHRLGSGPKDCLLTERS